MVLKTKSDLTVRNERAWISYYILSYSLQDSDFWVRGILDLMPLSNT
jgi:hypothetical protein